MVQTVNFNKRIPPGAASRGTLAELMAKSQAAADAKASAMAPVETPTIMQGLGHVAQVISGGIQEGRAQRSEAEARDALAKIQATVGLEGATPEQLAEIGRYDPQIAQQYREEAVQARRDAAARAEAQLDRNVTVGGQNLQADVAREGHDVTKQGNVLSADVTKRGQDITQEGNVLSADTTKRGQDITQEGNVLSADVTKRGQDVGATTAANALELETTKAADAKAKAVSPSGQLEQDISAGKYGDINDPVVAAYIAKLREKEAAIKGPDTVLLEGSTTIRKKLYETMGTKIIPAYMTEAKIAGDTMRDMEILDQLDPFSEGPIAGNLVQAMPFLAGFDSQAAAFNSIVQRLAPQQRAEGSGSTSDIEYTGLLASMPQLRNYPEANDLIRESIKARSDIAIQRGQIINEFQRAGDNPEAENILFDKLAQLDAQSIMNPRLQAMIDEIKKKGTTAASPGAAGGGVKQPGNPALEDALGRY